MRVVFLALGFSAGIAAAPFAVQVKDSVESTVGAIMPTAVALPVCTPVAVNIYFERGQSRLSAGAQSTLGAMTERVRGCAIASIAIENQPSAVASEDGRRLAGLRGADVLRSLSSKGLAPEAVVIAESDTDEPAGAATPDHVRVSITPARTVVASSAKPPLPDNEI